MYPILRNDNTYLGGALKYDFLRYGDSDKLLKLWYKKNFPNI